MAAAAKAPLGVIVVGLCFVGMALLGMDSAHEKEDGPSMLESLSPQVALAALQSGSPAAMHKDLAKPVPGEEFVPSPLAALQQQYRPPALPKAPAAPSQQPLQHHFFRNHKQQPLAKKKVTPVHKPMKPKAKPPAPVKKKVKVARKPKKRKQEDFRSTDQKLDDFSDGLFQDSRPEVDQTVSSDFNPNPLGLAKKSEDTGLGYLSSDTGDHVLTSRSLGHALPEAPPSEGATDFIPSPLEQLDENKPAPTSLAKKVWPAKPLPPVAPAKPHVQRKQTANGALASLARETVRNVLKKPEPKSAWKTQAKKANKVKPLVQDGDKILEQFDQATEEAEKDMEEEDTDFDKPERVPIAETEQKIEKAMEAHNAEITKSLPKFISVDAGDFSADRKMNAFMPSPLAQEEKKDAVEDELQGIRDEIDGKKKIAVTPAAFYAAPAPTNPEEQEMGMKASQMHSSIWGGEKHETAKALVEQQKRLQQQNDKMLEMESLEAKAQPPKEDAGLSMFEAAPGDPSSSSQFFETPPSMLHAQQDRDLSEAQDWDHLANARAQVHPMDEEEPDNSFTPLSGRIHLKQSALSMDEQNKHSPPKIDGKKSFDELFAA